MSALGSTATHRAVDLLPLSGVIGAALFLVGSFLPGLPPAPDASAAEVVSFLVDHRSLILLGTAITLLSVPFFGVFVGSIRSAMADRQGSGATLTTAAVFGWTLLVATVSVGLLTLSAITWRGADRFDASTVQFGYDTSTLALYALSAPAAALAVGAASVAIIRTRLLPTWIAVLGFAEVGVNLIELLGLTARTGIDAGGYAAGIGPLLWSAWVVVFAVGLARPTSRDRCRTSGDR